MPLVPFADASGSGGSKSRPMTAMNSPRSAPTTPREPSRRAASAIPSPRSSHGTPRSSQSARGTRVPLQSTFDVAKAVSALAGSGLVRTSFLSELGPLRRPLGKEKLAMGSHTLDLTRTRFVPGGALEAGAALDLHPAITAIALAFRVAAAHAAHGRCLQAAARQRGEQPRVVCARAADEPRVFCQTQSAAAVSGAPTPDAECEWSRRRRWWWWWQWFGAGDGGDPLPDRA